MAQDGVSMWRLLRTNRDLRLLFFAQVVSYCGDWFAYVALVGLIKDVNGSSFQRALVYVAMTFPQFLLSPVAGAMADRHDRKRILVTVSLFQSVAALALLGVGAGRIWLGFVAQATIAALAAFVPPASQAGIPNLVRSEEEIPIAGVLFGSVWGVMLAVGAALGGVFAEAFGRDAAFVANAMSFVLAAALVSRIRRPMQAPRAETGPAKRVRPLADMNEALTHARHDHVLLALLASKAT